MPFGYKTWGDFVIDCTQYYTVKFVAIQYWPLGFFNYSIKAIIFCYIVGYTIIYNNGHLKIHILGGSGFMNKYHATVNYCNWYESGCKSDFSKPTEYKYCTQYTGLRENGSTIRALPCEQLDTLDLNSGLIVPGGQFIVTKRTKYNVTGGCTPNVSNGYACKGKIVATSKISETFVMGPGEQKLHVMPWLNTNKETENLVGAFPPVFLRTAFPAKVDNVKNQVKDWRGTIDQIQAGSHLASLGQNEPSAAVNPPPTIQGDLIRVPEEEEYQRGELANGIWRASRSPNGAITMRVSDLLRLAAGEAAVIGKRIMYFDMVDVLKEESIRETGRAVVLHMYYTNRGVFDPLGKRVVSLEVSAQILPFPHEVSAAEFSLDDKELTIRNGIFALVVSYANLQTFDLSCALSVLAASVVLFAASMVIVDYTMMYLPGCDNWRYKMLKRQPWHNPIIDPYLYPPALNVPATKTYDTARIYENIMLNAAANNRSLQREELLIILAKLDTRLNKLDAFHMEDTTAGQEVQRYIDAFEVDYIEKTS